MKRKRQLRLTYEKLFHEESQGKSTGALKKTAAMLASPYTQSAPINGIIYVTFDDAGIAGDDQGADEPDVDEKEKTKKKAKKTKEGTDDNLSDIKEAANEESQMSELIYEPDEEYGAGGDDDDFGAAGGDDDY